MASISLDEAAARIGVSPQTGAGGAQFYGPPLALERTPLSPPPNKQHRKNQPKPPKFSQSKATNQRQSTAPSPISAEGTC